MIYVLDCEVFQSGDWCFCIKNCVTGENIEIVNDSEKLKDFYEKTKNFIYCAFNSSYDMYIFKAILGGYNPVDMNNHIIEKGLSGYTFDKDLIRFPMNFFDIYIQGGGSLKKLEGWLGHDITESTVDFKQKEPLTEAQWEETLRYCNYDVTEAIEVMCRRKNEFIAKWDLIKKFDLPTSAINRTKAQLGSTILDARKQDHNDEWDLQLPECRILSDKLQFVVDWFLDPKNHNENSKLPITVAGCSGNIGFGGIHLCRDKYVASGDFMEADVESLYPTIMINFNLLSRNTQKPELFKEIYETRLRLKHEGKKQEQQPYKIILNSNYGSTNFEFSDLYDPRQAHSVCVIGQIAMLDLIEKIEDIVMLISANTDSIYVKLPEVENKEEIREEFKRRVSEWEKRYGFKMEYAKFDKIAQRDVNFYCLRELGKKGPEIKGKGAYCKSLTALDWNLAVINKAVVSYFMEGIPVEKTIQDNDNLIDFQNIVHLSSLYNEAWKNCTFSKESYIKEDTGRKNTRTVWNKDGEKFEFMKTFRVFASKNTNDGGIYKRKIGKNPEKFANTPEHCFVLNSNIVGKKCSEFPDLDKVWYINLANKIIGDFYK